MSEGKTNEYRCGTCDFGKTITDFDETRCLKHNIIIGEKREWLIKHIGCASHSSFANSTEHLKNLIKHFKSMDDHEELYLCDIIELLKGKKKI